MKEFLLTVLVIVSVNTALIIVAAYIAVTRKLLPGVEWRWPWEKSQ